MSTDLGPEHSPVKQEYAGLAKTYDKRWPSYVQASTRETAARLALAPGDRVLDIGCGTGALLRHLSGVHPAGQLTGVDPVPEMLAVARRRLSSAIELQEGWAEQIPLAAEQFDAVVSCSVFHYIREPAAALGEMLRVLRPGGKLVVTDWCDDYLSCRLYDCYLRRFSRAHHRVYQQRQLVRLVEDSGFSVTAADRFKISWLWGLMTVTATKCEAGHGN